MRLIGFTLARYLSQRFLRSILGVFITVFALIYTLDFVELMRRAGDAPGATAATMAQLALYRTPAVAEQILPFAVLFGSMSAMLALSRKLELVVVRSAGVSAWEFLQPPFVVALLLGAVAITLYNPVSARLKQKASEIEARIFVRGQRASQNDLWLRQRSVDGQSILRANGIDADGTTLINVTLFTFDQDGGFRERIEAKQAVIHDGYWQLEDARVVGLDSAPEEYKTYLVSTYLRPDQVRQSFKAAQSIPFWDLPEVIERTERAGLDASRYRLQFQSLLARPLLLIAMVIIASTVSLRFFRMGGVARMVLGGVAAGFVLYVAKELVEDLGTNGLLGAGVAAWSPAVVGCLIGTLALLHQEDG